MKTEFMDKIYLRNLRAHILVGINPEEKVHKQEVIINATLYTDCAKAAQSERIEDAVDYSVIHDKIYTHLISTQYDLIETMAQRVADICFENAAVDACCVSVDKPEALKYADSVAVEIFRTRND